MRARKEKRSFKDLRDLKKKKRRLKAFIKKFKKEV